MAGPKVGVLIGREVLEAYKHRPELIHSEDAGRGRGSPGSTLSHPLLPTPTGKPPKPYGGALGALGYQGK